jgi:hypothetical protein
MANAGCRIQEKTMSNRIAAIAGIGTAFAPGLALADEAPPDPYSYAWKDSHHQLQ